MAWYGTTELSYTLQKVQQNNQSKNDSQPQGEKNNITLEPGQNSDKQQE